MNDLKNDKFFEIDKRSEKDIVEEIKELSRSYTPEWVYNLESPDAGSVIASIYAQMLADDIDKLNMVMYKYQIELMNMIGLTLKPARPAECIAEFSLLANADEGAYVPRGTKLISAGRSGEKVVFETENSMYVTNSMITDIYQTSRSKGKIIDILDMLSRRPMNDKSFYLFDYLPDGKQKNELIIGHSFALNLNKKSTLSIFFEEESYSSDILKSLADTTKYEWRYFVEDGYKVFDKVSYRDRMVILNKTEDSKAVEFKNKTMCYISVYQKDSSVQDLIKVRDIKILSSCKDVVPEAIYQGDAQVDAKEFFPFGDKLAVYNECYIAADEVLSQRGALVTLNFDLSYFKNIVELDNKETIDYKVLMKVPQKNVYEMSETKAESVIFEYFNGVGWAKLDLSQDYSNLFAGDLTGDISIKFYCPDDIEKISMNAFFRNWIRIRLLKANNCYRVPCTHLVPVIKDIKLSYDFEGKGVTPEYILSSIGVDEIEISEKIKKKEETEIFRPIPYENNSLFIGLSKKLLEGPINIYFDIEGSFKKETDNIKIEYSCLESKTGFNFLKIVDGTENFRHSGSIIFIPPPDMASKTIFNKDRYWIKITDVANDFENLKYLKINKIIMNAVKVKNIETKEEEVFYIDKSEQNMRFDLSYKDILYTDVFVNEMNTLSLQQMDNMIKLNPENIKAEYDASGRYISFFVKWEEVDTFARSNPSDRHYVLDRSNGFIRFGDSINGKVPSRQTNEAIKVLAVVCNGDNGNVDIGAINKTDKVIGFVKNVKNPISAYNGYDIEKIDMALTRGASIINNCGRLVTVQDFEREVKVFSDAIDKVKCVAGVNEYGESRSGMITIAVLVKGFTRNSSAFHMIKSQIKNSLIEKCELSLSADDLNVIDPVFVEVCVDVWIEVNDYNLSFEIKNNILKSLELFIDPVNGNFDGEGWDIGKLPKEVQIYSFIRSKNAKAIIQKIIVTGKIKSINGVIEKEINEIANNPFVIGISGQHNVFVNF